MPGRTLRAYSGKLGGRFRWWGLAEPAVLILDAFAVREFTTAETEDLYELMLARVDPDRAGFRLHYHLFIQTAAQVGASAIRPVAGPLAHPGPGRAGGVPPLVVGRAL